MNAASAQVLDLRAEARLHRPALPAAPALAPLHASARRTWLGRMVNEHGSAVVFEGLARQIERAGAEPIWPADLDAAALAAECRVFADEERRHGVLCGAVVEALGGEAVAPALRQETFPEHEDAGRVEALVRNLLSVSCLSETVAVALIGAERLEMPEGPLRELLTRIYADEVGHARFGWTLCARLVPCLDDDARARLGAYLQVALAHLHTHELAHLPLDVAPPPEGAALGLCSGADARELFYDTVDEVIVPGLTALGLPALAPPPRTRSRACSATDPSGRP